MEIKYVRDVLVDINSVPKVHRDATLRDAVKALAVARANHPEDRLPFRVALVVDDNGEVIGKLGHLAFLSAMEPGYERRGDKESMHRANVDPGLVESMSGHLRLLQPGFPDCCFRAAHFRVADVMHPLEDAVDADMLLISAVSFLVKRQTLSVLVRRENRIVGLLRLADIFDVIANLISSDECSDAARKGDET